MCNVPDWLVHVTCWGLGALLSLAHSLACYTCRLRCRAPLLTTQYTCIQTAWVRCFAAIPTAVNTIDHSGAALCMFTLRVQTVTANCIMNDQNKMKLQLDIVTSWWKKTTQSDHQRKLYWRRTEQTRRRTDLDIHGL